MKKLLLLVFLAVFVISCENENEQHEEDIELIEAYLKENNIEAHSTDSGLYYAIDQRGSGDAPVKTSVVKVNYKGYLLDGTVFDEGTTESYLFKYIQGWQEGLLYFNKGAKGKLFIPSKLGYGERGQGSIPANSVLIFDIEMLEVKNPSR